MYQYGMRPAEIILRRGDGEKRRIMEEVNLRYNMSTFVNVTIYPQYNNMPINYFKYYQTMLYEYKEMS
jgi:hypothetical protein